MRNSEKIEALIGSILVIVMIVGVVSGWINLAALFLWIAKSCATFALWAVGIGIGLIILFHFFPCLVAILLIGFFLSLLLFVAMLIL